MRLQTAKSFFDELLEEIAKNNPPLKECIGESRIFEVTLTIQCKIGIEGFIQSEDGQKIAIEGSQIQLS